MSASKLYATDSDSFRWSWQKHIWVACFLMELNFGARNFEHHHILNWFVEIALIGNDLTFTTHQWCFALHEHYRWFKVTWIDWPWNPNDAENQCRSSSWYTHTNVNQPNFQKSNFSASRYHYMPSHRNHCSTRSFHDHRNTSTAPEAKEMAVNYGSLYFDKISQHEFENTGYIN